MLKVAIVGVGGWGEFHVRTMAEIAAEGLAEIVALVDPSPIALENVRGMAPDARCHTGYAALWNAGSLDAVVLAVPIPLHEEMAAEALKHGVHVLLEKPAVPLMSQWKRLSVLDEKRQVAVAFQRITSQSVRRAKELLVSGAVGELTAIEVHGIWPRGEWYYSRAGWAGQVEWRGRPVLDGPATNALSHFVNDLMYLSGREIDSFGRPLEVCAELYRARDIPSYDTVCLSGALDGGASFFAGFSHAAEGGLPVRMRVTTTRGCLWIEEDGGLVSEDFDLRIPAAGDGRREMVRAFVDFASGRRERPGVYLEDVEGYTLATNLMFQSSGGIYTIPESDKEIIPSGDQPGVVSVKNLKTYLQAAADAGCNLAKGGAPWAREGRRLSIEDFSEQEMLRALGATA